MAQPTYHITPDVPGAFLRIVLTGDWDTATTARFAADVTRTLSMMLAAGVRHGELRTLVDMREKHILPQHVAAEFAKFVRPDSPSKRIALIVSTTLHRLQVKRFIDTRWNVFDTEDAALAWLQRDDPAGEASSAAA